MLLSRVTPAQYKCRLYCLFCVERMSRISDNKCSIYLTKGLNRNLRKLGPAFARRNACTERKTEKSAFTNQAKDSGMKIDTVVLRGCDPRLKHFLKLEGWRGNFLRIEVDHNDKLLDVVRCPHVMVHQEQIYGKLIWQTICLLCPSLLLCLFIDHLLGH